MNYYERHLGDYTRDTAHLSLLEHGVYTILLDRYYITEQGIPNDSVYRIARARTDEEREAVDIVLKEFFQLVNGFWINQRAEEEITRANIKIDSARNNGKKGGRPSLKDNPMETQQKPSGFDSVNPMGTQEKAHQTPDTRHHTPVVINNTQTIPDKSLGEIAEKVCVAYREMGMAHTNPMHADLVFLIQHGVEFQDFVSAGSMAIQKKKGFSYALGIAKGRLEEKKQGVIHAPGKRTSTTSRLEHSERISAHLDKLIAQEFGQGVDIGAV